MTEAQTKTEITFEDFKAEVLNDYRIIVTGKKYKIGRAHV